MKRLLTAAIGIPLALAALFLLPSAGFFVLVSVVIGWGAVEFIAVVRPVLKGAQLWLLLPLVLALSVLLAPGLIDGLELARGQWLLMLVMTVASVGVGSTVLLSRAPVASALGAMGTLVFAAPYFAVPIASLYHLKDVDPWLVFLLMGIVWLGDSAAYYVGSAIGRHKMTPVVSPNKSWEGAAAGLLLGLLMTLAWTHFRLGRIEWPVVAVCLATGVAAQLGDLVESMIKRGVGAKDSGRLLPGHGGLWDRMDAMLFAAPVLDVGMRWLGTDAFLP